MLTVVSAGTPDYRPMMEENRRRCEALGYRYVAHDLDLSSDLQGALPPCTFKPELMLRELRAIQPKHQPFEYTPEIIAWMDADAILVRDLSPLESINFDVAVTLRPAEEIGTTQPTSNYLNAGVIFFRPGGAACQFAADWATLTAKVRNDQLALNQMVGAMWTDDMWRNAYDLSFNAENVSVRILRASEYNFSSWNSRPPADCRVLHFKHGWRELRGQEWWKQEVKAYG